VADRARPRARAQHHGDGVALTMVDDLVGASTSTAGARLLVWSRPKVALLPGSRGGYAPPVLIDTLTVPRGVAADGATRESDPAVEFLRANGSHKCDGHDSIHLLHGKQRLCETKFIAPVSPQRSGIFVQPL
jgi:hypothetical protein